MCQWPAADSGSTGSPAIGRFPFRFHYRRRECPLTDGTTSVSVREKVSASTAKTSGESTCRHRHLPMAIRGARARASRSRRYTVISKNKTPLSLSVERASLITRTSKRILACLAYIMTLGNVSGSRRWLVITTAASVRATSARSLLAASPAPSFVCSLSARAIISWRREKERGEKRLLIRLARRKRKWQRVPRCSSSSSSISSTLRSSPRSSPLTLTLSDLGNAEMKEKLNQL